MSRVAVKDARVHRLRRPGRIIVFTQERDLGTHCTQEHDMLLTVGPPGCLSRTTPSASIVCQRTLSATSVAMCRRNRSSATFMVASLTHPTHHSHAARRVACHDVLSDTKSYRSRHNSAAATP